MNRAMKLTNEEKAKIILDEGLHFYGTTLEFLRTRCNRPEYVLPRQVIMYCLRKYTGLTLREIADYFGKDHATVVHSYQTVENLMEYNGYLRHFRPLFDTIETRLWHSANVGWADHIGTMISNYHELQVR